MKTPIDSTRSLSVFIAAIALAVGAFTLSAPVAEAGNEHRHHRHHHHAQVHVVNTIEVCRHRHFTWKHNHCGHAYRAYYTEITYKDIYSNGTSKTYKVTVNG